MVSILEMKKTLENALFNIPGVNGVGLSPDGTTIQVYTKYPISYGTIPDRMGDYPVETVYIGEITPLNTQPVGVVDEFRTRRYRPAVGGISVGDLRAGAGTLGGVIRDKTTGQKYIISNNHVLAGSDSTRYPVAKVGDTIIQPGQSDGGTKSTDPVATLSRWVPFNTQGNNLVDAALAVPIVQAYAYTYMLESSRLDVFRTGPSKSAANNTVVKKYSRTSSFDWGRIIGIDVTIDVSFGGNLGDVRFTDQIRAEIRTQPGDSGSLLLDEDNNVVGLLFASGSFGTLGICNKIRNVEAMLEGSDLKLEFAGDPNEPIPLWASADVTPGVPEPPAPPPEPPAPPPEPPAPPYLPGCTNPPGLEGATRCDGPDLMRCHNGGWVLQEHNAERCLPPPSYDCSDPHGIPGSVRCDGTTKLMCHNNRWITIQENSPECGYVPPPAEPPPAPPVPPGPPIEPIHPEPIPVAERIPVAFVVGAVALFMLGCIRSRPRSVAKDSST